MSPQLNYTPKTVNRPLKIITLYFQSIKKTELDLLLDTTKPGIIIRTETWLDPSISPLNTSLPVDTLCIEGTDPQIVNDRATGVSLLL